MFSNLYLGEGKGATVEDNEKKFTYELYMEKIDAIFVFCYTALIT